MLVDLIELACNQALEYDAQAQERLEALHDKCIVLTIRDIDQSITVNSVPVGGGRYEISLSLDSPPDPDIVLTASARALIEMVRAGLENADLKAGELEISGDPIVAQRFSALIANIDIDWEALLAEHLGELPAAYLSQGANVARHFFERGQTAIKARIREIIKGDMQLVTNVDEVENFLSDVDELRASVDRLSKRLNRIKQINTSSSLVD